jgi:hypothetical protein
MGAVVGCAVFFVVLVAVTAVYEMKLFFRENKMKSLFWLTIGTFFFGLLTMLAIVNILDGKAVLAVINVLAAGVNLLSASLHYETLEEQLKRMKA